MKNRSKEGIEFPANPFVALADFVIVLLIILILTVVHQSITRSSLVERAAVVSTQKELNTQGIGDARIGGKVISPNEFKEVYVDGDLQRFRLDSDLSFNTPDSITITPHGKAILAAFGHQLALRQGDIYHSYTRPFKRIIVEGHADRSEGGGSEERTWEISLLRAKAAITVLRQNIGKPKLAGSILEASGRGAYDDAALHTSAQPDPETARINRRLEIVVVYSGPMSLDYLKHRATNKPTSGGGGP